MTLCILSVLDHRNTSELWEGRFKVVQFECIRPVILIRSAQNFENFEDLINFRISHEKWPTLHHFCEDAPGRPKVHPERVRLLTKQDFRTSIPQCHHFMRISLNGQAESTS